MMTQAYDDEQLKRKAEQIADEIKQMADEGGARKNFDALGSSDWLEFAIDGHCGLCGNTGYLVTRDDVTSPNGQVIGSNKFYCICPSGRIAKVETDTGRDDCL